MRNKTHGSREKDEGNQTHNKRPYVGDFGMPLNDSRFKVQASLGMIVFAVVVGFGIGMAVWAVFWASSALTSFLWNDVGGVLRAVFDTTPVGSWWLPLAICVVGGLIIGLWSTHFGGEPTPLEEVMGEVKNTGGYRLERPGASVVGFILPLCFGGSIGPEAGLTGIIAAACTRIGSVLRAAGLRVKSVTDMTVAAALSAVFATPLVGIVATAQDALPREHDGSLVDPAAYDFRRSAKITLYCAAAFGAAGGVALFTSIFGMESGIPRFGGITPQAGELVWMVPCIVLGYLGALLFHGGNFAFSRLGEKLGAHTILKPVIAGVVLGATALVLPYVLFPGEAQAFELMESWESMGAVVLIATGLVKCLATPLCLHFGWRGGHIFPLLFAGIACGYGIAVLSGIDPMFCVAVTTASLTAGVQRKPLMALALLLLCFPVSSLIWMAFGCLAGAALPMPKRLFEHTQSEASHNQASIQDKQGEERHV